MSPSLLVWVFGVLLLVQSVYGQTSYSGYKVTSTSSLPAVLIKDVPKSMRRCPWPLPPAIENMHHGYLRPSPTIVRGPKDVVVFPDDPGELVLPCEHSNGDDGRVTWHFKPSVAANGGRHWSLVDAESHPGWTQAVTPLGSSLVYNRSAPFRAAMAGYYRCKVSVKPVGSVVSWPAELRLASTICSSERPPLSNAEAHGGPDSKHSLPSDGKCGGIQSARVETGSSLLLPCLGIGNDWSAYTRVRWTVNGKPLSTGSAVAPTDTTPGSLGLVNGTLYLWSIPRDANGSVYQCQASSASQVYAARSRETLLLVSQTDGRAPRAPTVQLHMLLSSRHVRVDDRLILACEVADFSPAHDRISWSFRGRPLQDVRVADDVDCSRANFAASSPSPALVTAGMRVLVLCDVTGESAGEYSCEASYTDDDGVDMALASSVEVEEAPRLLHSTQGVVDVQALVPGEGRKTLDCAEYIRRGGGARVTWYYNGAKVKHGDGAHAMKLAVNSSYPGMLQCAVQNEFGRAIVAFRIRVSGRPAFVNFNKCNPANEIPACFSSPQDFNTSITHYIIGEKRSTQWRFGKAFFRLDVSDRNYSGVMIGLCRGATASKPARQGCTAILVACNRLGCGPPQCRKIRLSGAEGLSSMGFYNQKLVAINESAVSFSTAVNTMKHFICRGVFRLHHPAGNYTEKPSRDLCDTPGAQQGLQLQQHFSNLESCVQYRGCVHSVFSDAHVGLDASDLGRLVCEAPEKVQANPNPKGVWFTVKTPRSTVPKKNPDIVSMYRLGSDALVLWKPSIWCDMMPHALFQWTKTTSTRTSGGGDTATHPVNRFFYHSNASLGLEATAAATAPATQLYMRRGLETGARYTLNARSCGSFGLPLDAAGSGAGGSGAGGEAATAYSPFEPYKHYEAKCSAGSGNTSFVVPANQSSNITVDESGVFTLNSSWSVHGDLKEHIEGLFVNHSCGDGTDVVPVPRSTAVSLTQETFSHTFNVSASGSVTCNFSLSATFRNYNGPPLTLSKVQVVTRKSSAVAAEEDEPPTPANGDGTSATTGRNREASTVGIAASVFLLGTIAIAVVARRQYRKRKMERDHIYTDLRPVVMRFSPFLPSLSHQRTTDQRQRRPPIPTPAAAAAPRYTDTSHHGRDRPPPPRVWLFVNETAEREGEFGACVDDVEVRPYDTTTVQRVLHGLRRDVGEKSEDTKTPAKREDDDVVIEQERYVTHTSTQF